jgi:hypothetical protein
MERDMSINPLERAVRRESRWEGRLSLLVSIATLVSIGFTYQQVLQAQKALRFQAQQQLLSASLELDKFIAANPELRPYLREGMPVPKEHYNKAAAAADMALDVIDGNLEFAISTADPEDLESWRSAFGATFETSPIVCEVFLNHKKEYTKKLREIGESSCKTETSSLQ